MGKKTTGVIMHKGAGGDKYNRSDAGGEHDKVHESDDGDDGDDGEHAEATAAMQ